jgi:hypothetical protein
LHHNARLGRVKSGTLVLQAAALYDPVELVQFWDYGSVTGPLHWEEEKEKFLYVELGRSEGHHKRIDGLILTATDDERFKRVGYFSTLDTEQWDKLEQRVFTII